MRWNANLLLPVPNLPRRLPHSPAAFALATLLGVIGCQSTKPSDGLPFEPMATKAASAHQEAPYAPAKEPEPEAAVPYYLAPFRAAGAYFVGRALDFADIFEARAGYGLGLFAGVRITVLSTGVGADALRRYGFDGRDIGIWSETELGIPFNLFTISEQDKQRMSSRDMDIRVVTGTLTRVRIPGGSQAIQGDFTVPPHFRRVGAPPAPSPPPNKATLHKLDITASVAVLLLGAKIGVHPCELLDFLLGLLTIDIARDDPRCKFRRTDER